VSLTKSILSSQPVYFVLTALWPSKEILKDLEKLRRRFLWAGDKQLTDGKCKVNWIRNCLPKESGGLGIPNLEKFARALRLRWLWHQWVSSDKPWVGTATHATMKTNSCSRHEPPLCSETARKRASGTRVGSRAAGQRTLHLPYSKLHGKRRDQSTTLRATIIEFTTSVSMARLLMTCWMPSSNFGPWCRQCTCSHNRKTPSSGSSPNRERTPLPLLIRHNFLVALQLQPLAPSGNPGRLPNANSLHGSSHRTEFGPRIDWHSVAGRTTTPAFCAEQLWRRHTIY
jgi:hypothetical protein